MRKIYTFLALLGAAFGVFGGDAIDPPAVGDMAPDVLVPNPSTEPDAPESVKLSSLRGNNVVLAFYPKAFTSGCTAQLCGYRDDFAQFRDLNTTIIAISGDDQDASDRFRAEHELPFSVVGDASGELIKAFGIPATKVGGTVVAKRAVVLIDTEGRVRYVDLAYSVNNGQKPLLEAIAAVEEAA
jgi:peroxiredoxin